MSTRDASLCIRGVGARTLITAGRRPAVMSYKAWDPFVSDGDIRQRESWILPGSGSVTAIIGSRGVPHVSAYLEAAHAMGDGIITISPMYRGSWSPPKSCARVPTTWQQPRDDDAFLEGILGDVPRLQLCDGPDICARLDQYLAGRAAAGWYNTVHIVALHTGGLSQDTQDFIRDRQDGAWGRTGCAIVVAGLSGADVACTLAGGVLRRPDPDACPTLESAAQADPDANPHGQAPQHESDAKFKPPMIEVHHGVRVDTVIVDGIESNDFRDQSWTWATLRHVSSVPCADADANNPGGAHPCMEHGIIATDRQLGEICPVSDQVDRA